MDIKTGDIVQVNNSSSDNGLTGIVHNIGSGMAEVNLGNRCVIYNLTDFRVLNNRQIEEEVSKQQQKDKTLAAWLGCIRTALTEVYRDKSKRVAEYATQEDRLIRELYNLKQERQALETYIRSIKSKDRNKSNVANVMYCLKSAYEYYESVTVSAYGIVAVTKPVVIKKGYNVGNDLPRVPVDTNLGKFTFTIRLSSQKISVVGTEQRSASYHPHISVRSGICLGTFANQVLTDMANRNIGRLLLTLWDYLHTIDGFGWYHSIFEWFTDKKDRCPECWELVEECRCDNKETGAHECPYNGEYFSDTDYCIDRGCEYLGDDGQCNY